MDYTKTQSKNWFDHEIIGVINMEGKKVIYLKSHVKRQWKYNDSLYEGNMDHLNKKAIATERMQLFYKWVLGIDAPDNN